MFGSALIAEKRIPMQELSLIPMVKGTGSRLMHSALPCSPVVPDRPPGRLRLLLAGVLHRLAARLDRGLLTWAGDGRPARPANCVS
jgi:hypothetical protein